MISGVRESAGRWLREDDRGTLIGLYGLVLVIAVLMTVVEAVTAIVLMFPLVVAALVLPPRRMPAFVATTLVALLASTLFSFWGTDVPAGRWISAVTAVAISAVVLEFTRRRWDLGTAGFATDSILSDLHLRLRRQAAMPTLPPGWVAESHLRPAGGSQFAGDFVLTHLEPGERLRLLLVDVSGKGVAAGPKSLLLSGAFGSLLAATEPADFLGEANAYICRQGWEEGFATAIQLTLDLTTGDFVLRSAGHPPAVQLHAGSGRWTTYEDYEGSVLGLIEDESYDAVVGRMMPGDAMLIYTDGLVEASRQDVTTGVHRLIGEADRRVHRGVEGLASRLVDLLGDRSDDCALVVLQRSSHVAAGPGAAAMARRWPGAAPSSAAGSG